MEWKLFKDAEAETVAQIYRRKRRVVANNGVKVATWWNQEVKDASRAGKGLDSEQSRIFFAFVVR